MALTVRDIQRRLEELAPPMLAEQWDNVGLLVGDAAQAVSTVLVALDAGEPVLTQAQTHGAELLIVHHPLLFSPLKRLTEDRGTASLLRRLTREDRCLIALHTNLDSAPAGLNQYVAAQLGLTAIRPLVSSEVRPFQKLVVYVPQSHVEEVRAAICEAGAGHIGGYSHCTFGAPGTGTFWPESGASPFIGTVGELERVAEVRLETIVPKSRLSAVLAAMQAHHPYEEVAFDLIPLENPWPNAGLGRIGVLPQQTTLRAFLDTVRDVLHTERLSVIGDPERSVRTVALVTGSGGDFARQAYQAGADLYLTGEIKHHQALLAAQWGMAVIDAGHFATERPAVDLLAGELHTAFSELRIISAVERDPLQPA